MGIGILFIRTSFILRNLATYSTLVVGAYTQLTRPASRRPRTRVDPTRNPRGGGGAQSNALARSRATTLWWATSEIGQFQFGFFFRI